jgi:hypothetical protein
MPIALADLLHEQQVILRLRSRKPANAIREIVDVLASDISGRKIAKPEAFLEQVFAVSRRIRASSKTASRFHMRARIWLMKL